MGWDLVEAIDNAVGTNFSGNGPGNSIINQLGSQIKRSDPGRLIGRIGTDTGNVLTSPFVAASDLLRGDTEQAGRTLGRAAGSTGNLISMGGNYLAQDNKEMFKRIGAKDPTGLVSDYTDFTSAQGSLVQEKNLTSDEIWGSARFGSKALAIGGVYANAGEISSWWNGGAAKDAALASTALKSGKPGDVLNAVSPGLGDTFNSYMPEQPSWLPDLNDLFRPINSSEAAPAFNQSGASDPGQGYMSAGGGISVGLVILAIAGALIWKAKRK